jgi:alkylhydroperoxidase/carboxymuconolactone decarboxylase family protein YurZ
MSEIKWEADLDVSKVDKALKESQKTVQSWVQGMESAGKKIDKTFVDLQTESTKASTVIQQNAKQEIGRIEELRESIKKLTEARDKSTSIEKIEAYNTRIKEQKQDLDELTTADIEHEKSQAGIVGTLGKWAVGLLTVTLGFKGFKAVMESTDRTSLFFHSTLEGLKTALDYFMKSIANADFSNFINGIRDAFRAGKDFTKAQEAVSNIRREYAIKEMDLNKDIEEQRRIFYEDDKTAINDKIKAADNMLALMKQKGDLEIDVAIKSFNAVADLEKKKNKMSVDDIRYAIENYQRVEDIGGAYNKLNKVVEEYDKRVKQGFGKTTGGKVYVDPFNTGAFKVGADDIAKIKQQMADLAPDATKMGSILTDLNSMNEKERQIVTDSILEVKRAENQYLVESKRVFRMRENLINTQGGKETQLKKDLADQEDLLQEAITKGDEEQIKDIGARIVALQKELDIRENIAKKVLETGLLDMNPINAVNIPDLLTGSKKGKTAESYRRDLSGATSFADSLAWSKGQQGKTNAKEASAKVAAINDENKALEKQAKIRNQIFDAAKELTYQLGQQLGLTDQEQNALGNALDLVKNMASGEWVSAVVNILSEVISYIPTEASKFAVQVEHLNSLLKEQQRLIDLSSRKGGQKEALQGEVDLLKEQQKLQEDQLSKAKITAWDKIWMGAETLRARQKKVEDLTAAIEETKIQIEDANQALTDFYTGDLAPNAIADAIAQGFQDGETSAADFADTFNGFMRTAIDAALEEMSKPEIAAWYQKFAADMASNGGLSEEEKADLKAEWDKIIADNEKLREGAYATAGINPNGDIGTPVGLTGSIARSITEDTGNELTGLIRRQSDDLRMMRDYEKMGVNHLAGIAQNTRETADNTKEIFETNKKLDQIISNTQPIYSGSL